MLTSRRENTKKQQKYRPNFAQICCWKSIRGGRGYRAKAKLGCAPRGLQTADGARKGQRTGSLGLLFLLLVVVEGEGTSSGSNGASRETEALGGKGGSVGSRGH